MCTRTIHVVENGKIFFLLYSLIKFHCVLIRHLSYLLICPQLGCVHVLAIMNNAAVNLKVQMAFRPCFHFLQIYTQTYHY